MAKLMWPPPDLTFWEVRQMRTVMETSAAGLSMTCNSWRDAPGCAGCVPTEEPLRRTRSPPHLCFRLCPLSLPYSPTHSQLVAADDGTRSHTCGLCAGVASAALDIDGKIELYAIDLDPSERRRRLVSSAHRHP